jgi:hypothetical protein
MRTEPSITIQERAQDYYEAVFDKDLVHLMDVAEGEKKPTKHEIAEYGQQMKQYPEDTAREAIEQHGYGMSKKVIYYVTLAGGGPAARLRVEVEDGEVIGASLQFCDWFEPWTDAPNQDSALVERYARLIAYYGE